MKLSQCQVQKNGTLLVDKDVQLGKDWTPDGHGCIEVVQDKGAQLVEGKFWYEGRMIIAGTTNYGGWIYKSMTGRMLWILITP